MWADHTSPSQKHTHRVRVCEHELGGGKGRVWDGRGGGKEREGKERRKREERGNIFREEERKEKTQWEVRKKECEPVIMQTTSTNCWAQLYIRHCTEKYKHHHYVEFQQHLLENIISISQMRKLRPSKARRGFPGGWVVKNLPANTGDVGLILGPGRLSWRRKWQRTQVILPGESHSLEYYSPLGRKELDMTYRLNKNNKRQEQRASS